MPDDINVFIVIFESVYLNHYMLTNHFAPQWLFTGRDLDIYDQVVNIDQLHDFIEQNVFFSAIRYIH